MGKANVGFLIPPQRLTKDVAYFIKLRSPILANVSDRDVAVYYPPFHLGSKISILLGGMLVTG